nr:PREDICTED: mucin-13 [Paralichthys olivaceus]
MAGKYNVFFVLWFVVASFASERPPRPNSIGLMQQPFNEAPAPTAGPPVPGTTEEPDPTAGPPVPGTTGAPDPTAGPPLPGTTGAPGSGGPFTSSSPSSTTAPDPCHINPCGRGSTCAARADQTFVCLCLLGDNYNYISKTCENAKAFLGELSLPDLTYKPEMQNMESREFKDAALTIATQLSDAFPEDGFSNATVLSLKEIVQRRVGSESKPGVTASIEINFNTNSKITTNDVVDRIEKADGLLGTATYQAEDLCKGQPCDDETTTCDSENGSFNCSCREYYVNMDYSSRICVACPTGEKTVDSMHCVKCEFGYSGFNCLESWKLKLVIVGSVLGGLLLITLILLPILQLRRSPKKSNKKNEYVDIGKPYVSHPPAKSPLANGNGSFINSQTPAFQGSGFEGAGMPRIPRATAKSSWDSRTNLEMIPSNSRQNLVPVDRNSRLYDSADDVSSYTGPQSNYYAPARPRSNPYAQNRPQNNPYAQNQGQTNPYTQNDGKW